VTPNLPCPTLEGTECDLQVEDTVPAYAEIGGKLRQAKTEAGAG
jgi:hypothetical protein